MAAHNTGGRAAVSESARKRALRRALSMLSYRARSAQEITTDLCGKGFSSMVIANVLSDLEASGLVCDSRLARDIVLNGQRSNKSRPRIYAELRKRGLEREEADKILEEHYDPDKEREIALYLMRKSLLSLPPPHSVEDIEKAAKRISRRGFSASAVSSALNDALEHKNI